MRRIAVILLLVSVISATCGFADALHRAGDAAHDGDDCSICLLLHAPMLTCDAAGSAPFPGLLALSPIPLVSRIADQSAPIRLSCRGPPIVV